MVKILKSATEVNKLSQGEILVAPMTTPDYIMAIHKAAAIITDEGGITCHAAILSREMKIPCIVGVKNATKILQTGDVVVMDTKLSKIKKN